MNSNRPLKKEKKIIGVSHLHRTHKNDNSSIVYCKFVSAMNEPLLLPICSSEIQCHLNSINVMISSISFLATKKNLQNLNAPNTNLLCIKFCWCRTSKIRTRLTLSYHVIWFCWCINANLPLVEQSFRLPQKFLHQASTNKIFYPIIVFRICGYCKDPEMLSTISIDLDFSYFNLLVYYKINENIP